MAAAGEVKDAALRQALSSGDDAAAERAERCASFAMTSLGRGAASSFCELEEPRAVRGRSWRVLLRSTCC